MTRRLLAHLAVILGELIVLVYLASSFVVHAEVPCEHRSAEHAASHHQTREADSRFHVMHGELPTCGLDDDKGDGHQADHHGDDHHGDDHNDGHKWYRNDGIGPHRDPHPILHGIFGH